MIDRKDDVFAKLKLWFDKNRNGISESVELIELKTEQIESIDLKYLDMYEQDIHGNETRQRSAVQLTDKTFRMIFDVWFNYQIRR